MRDGLTAALRQEALGQEAPSRDASVQVRAPGGFEATLESFRDPSACAHIPLPERRSPPIELPSGLRLLCIGCDEPAWVSLYLHLDGMGCVAPVLKWISTPFDVLRLLREETFDCVVIGPDAPCDPVALVQGIRAGGVDDPVVVLATVANDDLWLELSRDSAELLIAPSGWESRVLVPTVARAIQRNQLLRENQHLEAADRRRLVRERDEAEHLLQQQRLILDDLRATDALPVAYDAEGQELESYPESPLPAEIDHFYQELLRTYVIMGSGSLATEISRLAEVLCVGGVTPRSTLELHLLHVERLVHGLGNRSTRHVMARADLLALELMIHLADGYQRQSPPVDSSDVD